MRLSIVIAALIFIVSSAMAADNVTFIVLGSGTKSCGRFVQEFDGKGWPSLINSEWINGYLSSVNRFIIPGTDVTEGIDLAGRDLWIYNYCRQNPLVPLRQATDNLMMELLRKNSK